MRHNGVPFFSPGKVVFTNSCSSSLTLTLFPAELFLAFGTVADCFAALTASFASFSNLFASLFAIRSANKTGYLSVERFSNYLHSWYLAHQTDDLVEELGLKGVV